MTDDRNDLAERVAALEDAVRDLRDDDPSDDQPRPPHEPGRFADEYVVPAAVAVLEANVRALELLRAGLDAPRRTDGDRAGSASPSALERADRALDRLLAEMEEGSLPRDADARAIVEEARGLRDEIDDRLGDATGDRADDSDAADDTTDATGSGDADDGGVEIDVEDELASIRDELDRDATGNGDPTGNDANDADPDGDANG